MTDWDYGWLHSLTLRHRFDALPLFGSWARRGPIPMTGSATTVAAFGAVWEDDHQRVTYVRRCVSVDALGGRLEP